MWKRNRLKIGFIYGTFDHLAPSELEHLEKAHNDCDRLVIAIRSDAQSSKLNQDQRTRAYVLASMVFSDAVLVCDDATPDSLVANLQPDIVFQSR
jgi:D-beta-D-heptose 7-phosphate kinase/D-beta-D-heptose 1-phosphate adenosyltransferase